LASIIPPFLKKGDEIRIISTARKISLKELAPAIGFLKSKGYKVSLGQNLFNQFHQFAGTDRERANDLQHALNDTNVKAVWLARGGYGTHRIIEQIKLGGFVENPKWVVGYSDVTVLHFFIYSGSGIATLHATMPVNFLGQTTRSFTKMLDVLQGKALNYRLPSHPFNCMGKSEGTLLGGNLSIIYSLTGTKYFDIPKNTILFIEDLDEYLYHIDRMMMNLKLLGIFDKVAGLIVGDMSDMNDNAIPFGKNAEEIILSHIGDYGFPVVFGFKAGHANVNLPLVCGAKIKMEVTEKNSKIEFAY